MPHQVTERETAGPTQEFIFPTDCNKTSFNTKKKLFKRFPKTITAESLETFRNFRATVELKLAP